MKINKKSDIKLFGAKKNWENSAEKLIIHHTAISKILSPKQFFSVDRFHKSIGFVKHSMGYYMGYNFMIQKGEIHQARAVGEETAAQSGGNFKYLSMVFAGNYMTNTLSAEDLEAFRRLKRWLDEIVDKYLPLLGHRDVSTKGTLCPGKNIDIQELREIADDHDTQLELKNEQIAKMQVIIGKLIAIIISLMRKK